jgi:hypothetical protein
VHAGRDVLDSECASAPGAATTAAQAAADAGDIESSLSEHRG